MIGYRGASATCASPTSSRSSSTPSAGSGTRGSRTSTSCCRSSARRASCAPAASCSREPGLLDRPRLRALGDGRGAFRALLLERYVELGVAGISIGSNDLTQLVLGVDRDTELLADVFDERDPAVVAYLCELIPRAARSGCRPRSAARRRPCTPSTRSCSSAPGIDAISVNIDAVERTRRLVAAAEQRVLLEAARKESTRAADARAPPGHGHPLPRVRQASGVGRDAATQDDAAGDGCHADQRDDAGVEARERQRPCLGRLDRRGRGRGRRVGLTGDLLLGLLLLLRLARLRLLFDRRRRRRGRRQGSEGSEARGE